MHKFIKFKAHGLEFILRIASDSNNYVGIIYPFYVDAIINWDDSEEFLQKEEEYINFYSEQIAFYLNIYAEFDYYKKLIEPYAKFDYLLHPCATDYRNLPTLWSSLASDFFLEAEGKVPAKPIRVALFKHILHSENAEAFMERIASVQTLEEVEQDCPVESHKSIGNPTYRSELMNFKSFQLN